MPRGLDHIVHAVRDLDAAADFYRRLGFTVGARNRHPWGTHNHVVQLASNCFIEVLTVAEPEKLTDDGISKQFGRFNQDFIARHEGLSMLILESTDAKADAAAFAAPRSRDRYGQENADGCHAPGGDPGCGVGRNPP